VTEGSKTMEQDSTNKSATSGKNFLTKDGFDMTSKAVGIIGGLISAIVLIFSVQAGTHQRDRELRWNQAKLASDLQDDMLLNDPQAFNALRMTDWGALDYIIDGKKVRITREEVQEALNTKNDNNLSSSGVFVRESFDRLFYRMGKIERALKSELINMKDVCSPMDYYVPFLQHTFKEVLIRYMEQLHHTDALKFINRFKTTSDCSPQNPSPGSQ